MVSPEESEVRRETLRVRSLLGGRRGRDARSPHRTAAELAARKQTPLLGPYVTIRVGGPLNGIVNLTASDSGHVLVEAVWGGRQRNRIALAQPGEREALTLADAWANQLIDGREPMRDLLWLHRRS